MEKYKPFAKMSEPFKTHAQSMNGKSPRMPVSSPPSPADDPLDALDRAREELRSVTDTDDEDTGQFEISRSGLNSKGIPRWAMGVFGSAVALALLAVAIAWAIAYVKR